MPSTHRLGFTGDVMLGRQVNDAYRDGQRSPAALWGNLQSRLRGLDGLFVNLECCLSTGGEPWPGRRFHFRADPDWSTDALRAATVDCCTLANNHAMDFGPAALEDTLSALSAADIQTVGAGRTRAAARRPAAVDCRGLTVALVGFTDNVPDYAATDDRPGTAHVEFDRPPLPANDLDPSDLEIRPQPLPFVPVRFGRAFFSTKLMISPATSLPVASSIPRSPGDEFTSRTTGP